MAQVRFILLKEEIGRAVTEELKTGADIDIRQIPTDLQGELAEVILLATQLIAEKMREILEK